jgi:hypothetical protein
MLDPTSSYHSMLTADLSRWRQRIKELNDQIFGLTRDRDELLRKAEAATVLLGGSVSDSNETEAASLRNHIKTLMSDGLIRKPKEMRQSLEARGVEPERVSSKSGGFYNVLVRLADDGDLKRDAMSRYWDPTKSNGPTSSQMEDMLK